MDRDVTIRDALPGDYEALCALWREMDDLHARMLPSFFRRTTRPSHPREDYERALRSTDEHIRVAVEAGQLLALIHIQIYDTPPLAQMTPRRRAHVDSLVVAEAARRRGVGRRLLDDASSWARARGADEILLTVWAGNDAADRFYDALGFRRISTVLGRDL
jgi:ribosomal protein S18 acetylase RimI-like enzyme